jgi:uncharacterized protein (DUF1501 family)
MTYKALIYFYKYGGEAQHNKLTPYDQASYDLYAAMAPDIKTTPRTSLTPTLLAPTNTLPNGRQYAMAPALAKLKPIFDAGKLSWVLNAGNLRADTTKTQFQNTSVPLPVRLFAHDQQQQQTQSLSPDYGNRGWGGILGDGLSRLNSNPALTCINLAGNDVFLTGQVIPQYSCGVNGPVALGSSSNEMTFGSVRTKTALRAIRRGAVPHLIGNHSAVISARADDNYTLLRNAIDLAPAIPDLGYDPVHHAIIAQFKVVLQIMWVAKNNPGALGVERQIFMVQQGGFDLHSLATNLPLLHAAYADGIDYFWRNAVTLGLENNFIGMDASDFGRSGVENEDGWDHGWGGNYFVFGGPVKGGQILGTPPSLVVGGPDDVGQGRNLPSTAWEQIVDPVAIWFDATPAERTAALPYRAAISGANLDLLAPLSMPVNTATPVLSGATPVGSVLSLSLGTWANSPASFVREYRRDGVLIAGQNGATYTSVAADEGKTVTGRITATNAAGSATAVSNGITVTAAVGPDPDAAAFVVRLPAVPTAGADAAIRQLFTRISASRPMVVSISEHSGSGRQPRST